MIKVAPVSLAARSVALQHLEAVDLDVGPQRRAKSLQNTPQFGERGGNLMKKKTRPTPVPKQIRLEVKTILQHASRNNGEAAILFIDNKGVLQGRGNGSGIFIR